MSTLRDEIQRPYLGGTTLGEYARPLFICKGDEQSYNSAQGSYESAVARYKQSGSAKDHAKVLAAFEMWTAVAKDCDLRFSLPASFSPPQEGPV